MDDETDGWSATTLSVREALRDAIEAGGETDPRAAVATVVAVEGSAYRRPGAKRVLADESVGAITAGCLEGPVADLAERALADGPLCETFDLTGEDDTWDFGLGCNGVIDVLVEPADESFRPALERVGVGSQGGDAAGPSSGNDSDGGCVALLTVVGGDHPDAPVGARALVDEDGSTESSGFGATDSESRGSEATDSNLTDSRPSLPDDLLAALGEQAREFAAAGRSDTVEVETDRGTAAVFVDGLESVPELLVFGHGADVRPVARLARDVGFRVTVATARGARADTDQFPAAHDVVATRPSDVSEALSRPEDTYAVLMSHNFVDDRLALESLLETAVPYVGLMGPRKRFEQLREALAEAGVELSAADRERISTPVGLDVGGGEPTQIALSIVAEALAASNGRDGGRLTDSEGPIHPRSDLDDSS